jgi:hypothetical protein
MVPVDMVGTKEARSLTLPAHTPKSLVPWHVQIPQVCTSLRLQAHIQTVEARAGIQTVEAKADTRKVGSEAHIQNVASKAHPTAAQARKQRQVDTRNFAVPDEPALSVNRWWEATHPAMTAVTGKDLSHMIVVRHRRSADFESS